MVVSDADIILTNKTYHNHSLTTLTSDFLHQSLKTWCLKVSSLFTRHFGL